MWYACLHCILLKPGPLTFPSLHSLPGLAQLAHGFQYSVSLVHTFLLKLDLCSAFQIPICNYQPGMSIWPSSHRCPSPNMSHHSPLPLKTRALPPAFWTWINDTNIHPVVQVRNLTVIFDYFLPSASYVNVIQQLTCHLYLEITSHVCPLSTHTSTEPPSSLTDIVIKVFYHPAIQRTVHNNQLYMCHWELARNSESSLHTI